MRERSWDPLDFSQLPSSYWGCELASGLGRSKFSKAAERFCDFPYIREVNLLLNSEAKVWNIFQISNFYQSF